MTDPATPSAAGLPEPDGTDLARAVLARARGGVPAARRAVAAARGRRGRYALARGVRGQEWSGSDRDRRDPAPLEDVVGALVAEHGWAQDLSVHGVLARWDLVVGPGVAAHCAVQTFSDGLLTVRTDSTAWATQMRLLTPQLLVRLADDVGEGVVRDIRVLGPAAPSWVKGPRRVKGRGPRDTYG